jgi:hypothetical protein
MRPRTIDPDFDLDYAVRVARMLDAKMMSPLSQSANALGFSNQQPEYQYLWSPLGLTNTSTSAITIPSAAGAGALVPGALMSVAAAGVGSNPGPGGDDDGSTNYTVATVDLSAVSDTVMLAGILVGFAAPGSYLQALPSTWGPSQTGPTVTCMIANRGIVQVYVDNTTTIGHTLLCSTTSTHTGQAHDSGGTTSTYGTHFGVALQAVTVSTGPKLCWAKVNFAYAV